MLETKVPQWLSEAGILLLATGLIVSVACHRSLAAEKITFEYGAAAQSVSWEELEAFANTGEISASLNTLFEVSEQNPATIRWILTQQFPAEERIIYDLFNTAPGEYILTQTSNVVNSRSERANVKALRGALIISASDDNKVSLLELLRNYPTRQVYVNGKLLGKARQNLRNFVDEAGKYIKLPLNWLEDF